jgi:hypothetical protein
VVVADRELVRTRPDAYVPALYGYGADGGRAGEARC